MANINDFCNYVNWKYGKRFDAVADKGEIGGEVIIKGYSDKYDRFIYIGTLYWDDMIFETPGSIRSETINDGGGVFECFVDECQDLDVKEYYACHYLIDDCIQNKYTEKDLIQLFYTIETNNVLFSEMCELILSMVKFYVDEYIDTLKDIYSISCCSLEEA